MASFIIQLHGLRFLANHGVFEEERTTGNEFEVNISLKVEVPKETISSLHQTVNYAEVYRITKEIFSTPTPLLETLAQDVAEAIKQAFPSLIKISVQIIKLHPPIVSFTGSVSVIYRKSYVDESRG
ncbi:dihydroneopterin aldolase [Flavisolibacter ginsenosidimutans]|uniref:dihydroneopterin aldolase n=1 Tax=Flavisolibacter ginsenosidimutans TaxID=661481 RepID=UPI00155A85F4|nr:dihydroneopterin aldolase [Flavisolibacter ginsenosidimutans]